LNRIVLTDEGGSPAPREGEIVVAHVDAFSESDEAELLALDQQFGDWLRDGSMGVDIPALEFLAGREVPVLRDVVSSPGVPASGAARILARWSEWRAVDIPNELQPSFRRWVDLEVGSALDVVTVLVAPPFADRDAVGSQARCPR
jgi:hypothetical protein